MVDWLIIWRKDIVHAFLHNHWRMNVHDLLAAMTWGIPSNSVFMSVVFFLKLLRAAQDLNLSPTRPTVANSVAMQNRGVLQIETGYDAYPQQVPGNSQTIDTTITYTLLTRLRLDFGWSAFNHREEDGLATNGIGTISIGGKILLKSDHPRLPALGLQYGAELPTASQTTLQGYGQQVILILNHHYGKDGKLNVIVNGSLIQSSCQTKDGCGYGGQHSVALTYRIQEKTRIYMEVFGQNVPQSNTPPGTYFFNGLYRQFGDSFAINGGVRFGLTDHSSGIGATVGLVFGKHL